MKSSVMESITASQMANPITLNVGANHLSLHEGHQWILSEIYVTISFNSIIIIFFTQILVMWTLLLVKLWLYWQKMRDSKRNVPKLNVSFTRHLKLRKYL